MNEYLQKTREEITAKIIEAVEAGTAPWMRPWDGRCGPRNGITGRMYTGINNMSLTMQGLKIDEGKDPRWLTFNQAKEKGWKVKKGSHGERVLLWKPLAVEDEDGNTEIKAIWQKVFTVFHASQIDGITEYVPPKMNEIELQEKAEKIIESSGAVIRYGGNQPCFMPLLDRIQMPERGLQVFTYGVEPVRTININGEVWFVAKDVCDILELGNITEALRGLDDDELSSEILKSGGQNREMKVISEAGLYTLDK